jgi:hypothetical protein
MSVTFETDETLLIAALFQYIFRLVYHTVNDVYHKLFLAYVH